MKALSFVVVVLGLAALLMSCVRATPMVQGPHGEARGPVYVDEAELLLMESHPVQVALVVRGSLPTPCHQVGWEVIGPDPSGRIDVRLYSLLFEGGGCAAVLEPFEARIPIGSYADGAYTVWMNDERVGQFELP